MLQEEDDCCDWKLPCNGREKVQFEARLFYVLEARGNSEQDLDGVLAIGQLSGAAVKEGSQSQDDDDECVTHYAGEEEPTGTAGPPLLSPFTGKANSVK